MIQAIPSGAANCCLLRPDGGGAAILTDAGTAAGVERAATKYVDSHVEYQRGVAYAVHVEIGVYTKGVGTERSSYLVDIETVELLQPVEAID